MGYFWPQYDTIKKVFYSSCKIMWSWPFQNIRLNTWANIDWRHRYYNRSVYDILLLRINTIRPDLTSNILYNFNNFLNKTVFSCGCLRSKITIKQAHTDINWLLYLFITFSFRLFYVIVIQNERFSVENDRYEAQKNG